MRVSPRRSVNQIGIAFLRDGDGTVTGGKCWANVAVPEVDPTISAFVGTFVFRLALKGGRILEAA